MKNFFRDLRSLPMHSRLLIGSAWTTITTAMMLLVLVMWWLLYPYTGLTMECFKPESPSVKQGALLTYTVKYCVDERLPLPITVNRELELQTPETSFPLAPTISYVITQRCETRRLFAGIPEYIPPGTYHLHATSSIQVNPIRTVIQPWHSDDFTVVAK